MIIKGLKNNTTKLARIKTLCDQYRTWEKYDNHYTQINSPAKFEQAQNRLYKIEQEKEYIIKTFSKFEYEKFDIECEFTCMDYEQFNRD